jgi:hypothetical protein
MFELSIDKDQVKERERERKREIAGANEFLTRHGLKRLESMGVISDEQRTSETRNSIKIDN